MRLYYVNPGNDSVIEAQVYELLAWYNTKKYFSQIVLLQGYRSKSQKEEISKKLLYYKFEIIWFKTYPNYFAYSFLSYLRLRHVLQKIVFSKDLVFHVRGELYGRYLKRYFNKINFNNLLVDIRGVRIEEINEYLHRPEIIKKVKIRSVKKIYSQIRRNTKISVVSQATKKYLVERYSFNASNIYINHNIAGVKFNYSPEDRIKVREKYNIEPDEIVAIFSSGGSASWQKDKDVLDEILSLGIRVFNLSKTKIAQKNVINLYLPFYEMAKYYSAADIGVLWRDNSIVNETASPSKLSEFAALGLLILHNNTIQVANEFCSFTNSGLSLDLLKSLTKEVFKEKYLNGRMDRINKGNDFFSVNTIGSNYYKIYCNLFDN